VHPFGELSAYLDGALSPEARTSVQAHLDTCAPCRTRLAELRGTARLIASLPTPVPSRSLVPRIAVPVWMAPLRTFSTFASAAAIVVFLATAAVSSFPRMTGAGSAPAAAPAQTAALDQARGGATSAPSANQSAADQQKLVAPVSASGSPGAAFNIQPSPTPAPAERSTASDATGRQDVGSASASSDFAIAPRAASAPAQAPFNPFPWLWLVLGIAFAALSFILGRRLRLA
jgi:anti-sigma factor RsiW